MRARGEDRRHEADEENEIGGGRERGHEAREKETEFGWWRQKTGGKAGGERGRLVAKGGDRRRKGEKVGDRGR